MFSPFSILREQPLALRQIAHLDLTRMRMMLLEPIISGIDWKCQSASQTTPPKLVGLWWVPNEVEKGRLSILHLATGRSLRTETKRSGDLIPFSLSFFSVRIFFFARNFGSFSREHGLPAVKATCSRFSREEPVFWWKWLLLALSLCLHLTLVHARMEDTSN